MPFAHSVALAALIQGLWRLRHNTVRPDAVGTDQPQPVDALGVTQMRCAGCLGVHSVFDRQMDQLERVGKGTLDACPIPARFVKALRSPPGKHPNDLAFRTPAPHRFRRAFS